MNDIHIYSAGRHDSLLEKVRTEYEKRLSRHCRLTWHLVKTGTKETENNYFREQLKGKKYVALDSGGISISTESLAHYVDTQRQRAGKFHFLIGGSYGLDEDIRDHAAQIWNFGAITLPHQLVRIILLEQFYRADCLLHGHPYHH